MLPLVVIPELGCALYLRFNVFAAFVGKLADVEAPETGTGITPVAAEPPPLPHRYKEMDGGGRLFIIFPV